MATFFPEISETQSEAALAVFCRAPRLGQVKTRLARARGEAFALELYRAMLRDSFALACALAPDTRAFACYTPGDAFADGSELGALWSGATLAQRGDDLGARMLNALADLRARGFERVAVIGSDAPDLPLCSLKDAFAALKTNEVAIGPSFDGGFYLLGASCALPDAVFAGITWSRDDVCARLQRNLSGCGLHTALLPTWRDVDEEADLEALAQRLERGESFAPATGDFLQRR